MMKWIFPVGVGFVVTIVVATALAIVVLQPFVSSMFGLYIRTDADGLAFAPMLSGYMVITIALAWLMPRVRTGRSGWLHGAVVGMVLGVAIFLGDHLVTAGWSKIPALPMLLSGLVDTLAVMAGGIAVALVERRQTS